MLLINIGASTQRDKKLIKDLTELMPLLMFLQYRDISGFIGFNVGEQFFVKCLKCFKTKTFQIYLDECGHIWIYEFRT